MGSRAGKNSVAGLCNLADRIITYLSVVGKKYIVGLRASPYRRVTAQTAQFLEQHQAISLKELYTTQKTTADAYHSGSNRPLSMGHK